MSYTVGIDIGGTFTDGVLIDPDTGFVRISKVPTTPENPRIGTMKAIDRLSIDPKRIGYFVHGTTIATNTLAERKGAKLGLVTTEGFRDVLAIMRINRRYNYSILWKKPEPLVPRYLRMEVPERIDHKGRVVKALDEEHARRIVRKLKEEGVESIAICLLFSYVNDDHEKRLKRIIEAEYPRAYVSVSSEILPEFREYERTNTVVADAYIKPKTVQYLNDLEMSLKEYGLRCSFSIMKNNGGVMSFGEAKQVPIQTVNSGPAGGVTAGAYLSGSLGYERVINVDMGGTTFDVSLIERGLPIYTTESELEWGMTIKVPMIDIRSIGAGGGSIVWIDKGGLLKVGPTSAGAVPGPVCYGSGGREPTVTDANVILGILNPDYFLGGDFRLNAKAAESAIKEKVAEPLGMEMTTACQGVVDIVNSNMCQTIREMTVEQGIDVRELSLLAFGGAGPVHAAALAAELGIRRIIIPPFPGAFSALGTAIADLRYDFVRSYLRAFESIELDKVNEIFAEMDANGLRSIRRVDETGETKVLHSVDMRYKLQNYEVNVPIPNEPLTGNSIQSILKRFFMEYQKLYGTYDPGEPCELVNLRCTTICERLKPQVKTVGQKEDVSAARKGERAIYFKEFEDYSKTPIYERDLIPTRCTLEGPVIVEEMDTTTVIPPGWTMDRDKSGNLIMHRSS